MNAARAIIRNVFRQARASGLTAALTAVAFIATGICLSILPTAPETGGFELSAGFGLWPVTKAATLPAVAANLQFALAALVADTGGVLLALIWTAGFLPSFLDPAAASVTLAKPSSRATVFTARFLGVVLYVGLFAVLFVGATFFAIGIRTGVWTANYWLCIPVLVAHFAVFYSFSALLAVMSRNTTVCIVGSIVFWAFCWGMNYGRHALAGVQVDDVQRAVGGLGQIADIAYWIMPKPADFSLVLADALGADPSAGGWPAFRAVREAEQFFPLASILTSLASGAVILALAAFEFVHDEY
jgi:ABC-type transport system involved in multi-copper enzyme maturation permease subunit